VSTFDEAGQGRGRSPGAPEAQVPGVDRFVDGFLAFAAGDALGVPWEGQRSAEIPPERIVELPARGDWPRGATSDDSAQLWLVAECLVEADGNPTAARFLDRLADALPEMRAPGPTTQAAVDHYRRTGAPPPRPENPKRPGTNGAAMRILPVGWATPASDPARRRALVRTFSEATHPTTRAVAAAHLVAAMGARAIEGAGTDAVIRAAVDELDWLEAEQPDVVGAFTAVRRAADGSWSPPPEGVTLDAAETAAGVVHVLRSRPDLATALPYAVSLGGDTDTVAAIVGGILGCRGTGEVAELPWFDRVVIDDRAAVPGLADRLHGLRRAWSTTGGGVNVGGAD
jgi:ADP-ribosylglycohydrolase